MKILLLNKHPVISKLVRLSAQKLDYEFDEQAHYADTLPLYDVIVVDDSVSADLLTLQNKCKKLICISSGATNLQSTPVILHKPFLPTDLIALIKDEEKPATQEEQTAEANAEEGVVDDTPLDLDSLSFDMADTSPQSTQQSENSSETPNEADTNIYLQDIKADAPESANSDESLNLGDLNLENSTTTEDLSSQISADINLPMDNTTENSTEFNTADFGASENSAQDANALNLGTLSEGDNGLNLGTLSEGDNAFNLGDLPNTETATPESDLNTSDELNLNASDESVAENVAENSNENSAQVQPEEPKDEFSIEPIEFIQTPLPTLESSTNLGESAEQTSDTKQESAQSAEFRASELNLAQSVENSSENLGQNAEFTSENSAQESVNLEEMATSNEPDFKSVPDEELAFDSKDIADIMGLDEESIHSNTDTAEQEKAQAENVAQDESEVRAENLTQAEIEVKDENLTQDEGEAQDKASGVADIIASVALDDTPKPQDNDTQELLSQLNEINNDEADLAQENANEKAQDEAKNPALSVDDVKLLTQQKSSENLNAEFVEQAQTSEQNEAQKEENADKNAEFSAKIEQVENSNENSKADESASVDENAETNEGAKAEFTEQAKYSEGENTEFTEQIKADDKEKDGKSENELDLNFANAPFLQPLSEPFSIEEKKEGKISFDDLPENAQFLGQKSEESVEIDELRPILLDEPKAQSTQDMVKEQLAALNAMDNEEQAEDESDEDAKNADNADFLAQLKGVSEKDLQIALGEIAPDDENTPNSSPKVSENLAKTDESESRKNALNSSTSEMMDELSKGISGAITSSIKDDALKAALKGMNMHIDINIKFDEDKA